MTKNGDFGAYPGALTPVLTELSRAPEAPLWQRALVPGEVLDRYEIIKELGAGSLGVVYQAHDRKKNRPVAIKALRHFDRDHLEDRVLNEAEAAVRLSHPNIVRVQEVGRTKEGPYLVMELLRGESLAARLRTGNGTLPLKQALRVGTEVARALAHAHKHGVIHRDLRPSNVFLCENGSAKVLDFGLTRIFGKPAAPGSAQAYLAPELKEGAPGNARTDVYALGLVVYEMLAGQLPPQPEPPPPPKKPVGTRKGSAIVDRAVAADVPPPRIKGAPFALVRLLGRMLDRDPAQRPATAHEAHAALAAIRRYVDPRKPIAQWIGAALAIAAAGAFALRPLPPPPSEIPPLVYALADARNSTGEGVLDALGPLLRLELEQSERLPVLHRSALINALTRARRTAPAELDEAASTEAAKLSRADVLLVPSISRAGQGYELQLRALDLVKGGEQFELHERTAGTGGLLAALDRLCDQLRERLGDEPRGPAPEPAPPPLQLARLLPPAPEAWSALAEGQRLASEGQLSQALEAYERALVAAPDLPLAHAELAIRWLGRDAASARDHLDAASREADRLPPRERLLVEATAAHQDGRLGEAMERYDRAIASWPQAPEAHLGAGKLALLHWADARRARPYLERAVELGALTADDALDLLLELGRLDEALARAERFAAESPGPHALTRLAEVRALRGETEPALEAARSALASAAQTGVEDALFWTMINLGAEGDLAAALQGVGHRSFTLLAVTGQREAARAALEAAAPGAQASPQEQAAYHAIRGAYLWGEGDAEGVWAEAEASLQLGAPEAGCFAHLLTSLGEDTKADKLLQLEGPTRDQRLYCAKLDRSLRGTKAAGPERERALAALAGMYGPEPAFELGALLAQAGQGTDAVAALRRFRKQPQWRFAGGNAFAYPRSLYLEAVALERLGDKDAARAAVGRLLELFRNADRDLPALLEAKALSARLGASAVRGP